MIYIVDVRKSVVEIVCLQKALDKFQIYGFRPAKGTSKCKLLLVGAASRNDQEAYLVGKYNNKFRFSASVQLYGVAKSEVRSQ